jgi:hypothetical protein
LMNVPSIATFSADLLFFCEKMFKLLCKTWIFEILTSLMTYWILSAAAALKTKEKRVKHLHTGFFFCNIYLLFWLVLWTLASHSRSARPPPVTAIGFPKILDKKPGLLLTSLLKTGAIAGQNRCKKNILPLSLLHHDYCVESR